MKKGKVLNNEMSHVISTLGHTDTITVADFGLLNFPEKALTVSISVRSGEDVKLDRGASNGEVVTHIA